jgi:hypothetical protein
MSLSFLARSGRCAVLMVGVLGLCTSVQLACSFSDDPPGNKNPVTDSGPEADKDKDKADAKAGTGTSSSSSSGGGYLDPCAYGYCDPCAYGGYGSGYGYGYYGECE